MELLPSVILDGQFAPGAALPELSELPVKNERGLSPAMMAGTDGMEEMEEWAVAGKCGGQGWQGGRDGAARASWGGEGRAEEGAK